MTFKAMGVDHAEQVRRQEVCARLNVLWFKREHTEDPKKQKSIDRRIEQIRRQEAPWMRHVAFFLY